jgi:hypothetical protein
LSIGDSGALGLRKLQSNQSFCTKVDGEALDQAQQEMWRIQLLAADEEDVAAESSW